MTWQIARRRIDAAVAAAGFTDITPAHLRMLGWPEPRGVRPTVIAQRAGVSKQAAHQLLRHLEERGYVELLPDPTDDRARLVELTKRGRALAQVSYQTAEEIDREWAEQLGAERFRILHDALEELVENRGGARPTAGQPSR